MRNSIPLTLACFSVSLWVSATALAVTWEPTPAWQIAGTVITSTNRSFEWSEIPSRDSVQNGCLTGTVKITETMPLSAPLGPDGNVFFGKAVGTAENDSGYEAAVVFRQKGDQYYRVAFSSKYQEVVLWRTDGYFLAVKEFPIKLGEDIPFRIEFSGSRIKVSAGNKDLIDINDLRPLLSPGRVGLVSRRGVVAFDKLILGKTTLKPEGREYPIAFSQRKWHDQDWFFNGPEPIACLEKNLLLHCKIAACYRMIGYTPACWLQYLGPEWYANKQPSLQVQETGPQLKCLIQGSTPKGEIVSRFLTTITYDKAAKSYIYDFDTEFTVQEGKTWRNAYGLEFSDFVPYNAVGPAVDLNAWPRYYGWIVWQSKDGHLYKHPINHNGYYPALGERKESFSVKTDGGFIGFFNEDVNPVTRIIKSQTDVYHGLCAWAHDLHLDYPRPKEPMNAGTKYAIHFQLVGFDKATSTGILNSASFPPDAQHLDWEYPLYQAGVNDFQKGVKIASPHQVQLWRKGCTEIAWYDPPEDFWDRSVGYRDHASLRIGGPYTIGVPIGTSSFMPPFTARRHLISAMIKTENVKGEGPFISFASANTKDGSDRLLTGITGTHEWTKVAWVTEKLNRSVVLLKVGSAGTGKVWFDDVEIRALKDDESVALPQWKKAEVLPPMPGLLAWLKMDDKEGAGALDYSHHGSSAELRAVNWVQDAERGTCLEFDGKGTATIESKDELNFSSPFSFTCWLKPAAGDGVIFRKYNNIALILNNKTAPYRIYFEMNGIHNVHLTEPKVLADTWCFVTVTHDGKTVRIYLDGTKIWEKDQPAEKVVSSPFPLSLGGIWHEGRIFNQSRYCGRMGETRFYSTALSDEDVKKEFETGKQVKATAPQ